MQRLTRYKFKVVKVKSRISAMINGNSSFALRYLRGTDVWAREDTIGIMVFKTITDADHFAWSWSKDNWWSGACKELRILRVLPYGKGLYPSLISAHVDAEYLRNYYHYEQDRDYVDVNSPPDGTMCYKGVHVVD